MRSDGALARGSASGLRAGYGVSLQQTSLRAARIEKSAMAGTPSPALETRALPGEIRTASI